MQNLPSSTTRYRAALTAWIVITLLFITLFLYRLVVDPRDLLWSGIATVGSLVGIWRWIFAARRARAAEGTDRLTSG